MYSGPPIKYAYIPDVVLEHARNVTIKLHHMVARFIKIQLYFASRWLMISEVSFDSGDPHIFSMFGIFFAYSNVTTLRFSRLPTWKTKISGKKRIEYNNSSEHFTSKPYSYATEVSLFQIWNIYSYYGHYFWFNCCAGTILVYTYNLFYVELQRKRLQFLGLDTVKEYREWRRTLCLPWTWTSDGPYAPLYIHSYILIHQLHWI